MIVLDAHCDAPSQMSRLRNYRLDNPGAQVDFPKMRRGGVDASFFAAYVPAGLQGADATAHALRLLDILDAQMAENQDIVAYARCASGVRRNRRAGRISVLAGIENASALDGSLDRLREFYKRGVRYITLTHSADNDVADSCTGSGCWGGLSPFGRELVPAMNHIGMLVDLAHSADSTMRDVLEISARPVAYTHGCCRALASHRRNISDELIRAIAERGGDSVHEHLSLLPRRRIREDSRGFRTGGTDVGGDGVHQGPWRFPEGDRMGGSPAPAGRTAETFGFESG